MEKKKTLVMTGGGTGGHIIPNLALIPDLKKDFKIYYLGQPNSMEQDLISKDKSITFIEIPAVKFHRKLSLKNLAIPFKLVSSVRKTKKILREIAPNAIFCKGGYVSLPVAMAGAKLKIPVLSHESDFSMGLANKLIHRKAAVMFTSFRETCISDKCIYSGSPVRPQIFEGDGEIAQKYCHFPQSKPTIMFFGGSKGSKSINNFVFKNLDAMREYNIIHFVGGGNAKGVSQPNYAQVEFAENIYDYFALADIVVCRAGANSIFELLALRKPMLLIPLPTNVSRGDQIENANVFKKSGFAEVLFEEDLNFESFLAKIENLQKNKFYYISNMKKSPPLAANEMICGYIRRFAEKNLDKE